MNRGTSTLLLSLAPLQDKVRLDAAWREIPAKAFESDAKDILEQFLNSLPNGEIFSNGYYQDLKQDRDES